MKKNKGITLVSLVVTIIILIILAGISINMTIGNNGILTMAKKAKENIDLAQQEEEMKLNELYEQIGKETGTTGEISYDIIAKLNNFKKAIADYIEEAGGIKPEYTANTETFGESIKGIVKEVTKDATATEEDIEKGKTAWVNGELITGTKVARAQKTFLATISQSVAYTSTSTFNSVKTYNCSQIANYTELTKDNFSLEPVSFFGGDGRFVADTSINLISLTYNNTTGIVSVTTRISLSSTSTGGYGYAYKLYLWN